SRERRRQCGSGQSCRKMGSIGEAAVSMVTQTSERICIIGGAGHVGLPLALVLADEGFYVDILDTNVTALKTIMAGRMPFVEDGAQALLKRLLPTGRISATTDSWAVRNS